MDEGTKCRHIAKLTCLSPICYYEIFFAASFSMSVPDKCNLGCDWTYFLSPLKFNCLCNQI